jgi:hypothetical protein
VAVALAPSLVHPERAALVRRLAPFVVAALVLTAATPLWLLLLAPLVLGVPHVVADIRYLLLTPVAASRRLAWGLLVPLAALTALRLAVVLGAPGWPRAEVLLGLAAVVAGIAVVNATPWKRTLGLLGVGMLAAVTMAWPGFVAFTLGHLHNVIAIGLWLAWARASRRDILATVTLVAAAALAIGSGVFDPIFAASGGLSSPAAGLDLDALAATLAPGLGATAAVRVVLLFAFAQALHYAVWLVLLPAAARDGRERRSLVTTLRADLGRAGLAAALVASLAVPVAGLVDAAGTRAVYLSLVLFHGWLEVAIIARSMVARDAAPWA